MIGNGNRKIQEQFITKLHDYRELVSVFLQSGLQLRGKIIEFDEIVLLLEDSTKTQLVFLHSIATIMPYLGVNR